MAQTLRNYYNADLVVLMTAGDYVNNSDGIVGIVPIIGPDNANAYAIVETHFATSNQKVFAHELGHLFGGQHDNITGTNDRGYIFSTGWWIFGRDNWTIMATFAPDRGRIDHFSNPNVEYRSNATGTSNRNNALKLNNTGSTIAAFQGPPTVITLPIPFSVTITAPTTATECTFGVSARANITCGIAPYNVVWENSFDGIIWNVGSTVLTTSNFPTYSFISPCLGFSTQYFVRATVTDAQGDMRIEQVMIDILAQIGGLRSVKAPIITSIYPNPFGESTQVKINLPQAETIQMEITNAYGTVHKVLPVQKLPAGEHQITILRSGLPEGLYLLKLTTSNGVETKNIIINP